MNKAMLGIGQAEARAWSMLEKAKRTNMNKEVITALRAYWAGLYKATSQAKLESTN